MTTEDDGAGAWRPARLIPTAGIRGTREQEERATSALLAVLRAVPEFGKELVADLGAPRGTIETYTEVPLGDGSGGKVRPDGVIVPRRGKRLTQELGRDVVPRRLKKPLDERIDATCEELAKKSRLSMSLKIPDAVGSLVLTADLRARMTTTSVRIRAPEEGRPATQVRWTLRQLREAPDDLRLETRFSKTSKTTTALLGDVRDEPKQVLLGDDRQRAPREFHLSLARPMGTKKGTGPGSFITDTRQQAIDFYRDLVQHLTDWQPKAPKLREDRSRARPARVEPAPEATDTGWHPPPDPEVAPLGGDASPSQRSTSVPADNRTSSKEEGT